VAPEADRPPLGVIGWGEGGLLALYAGALDTRIEATCVSGYFSSHPRYWEEPISRNVFGRLDRYGDAELAGMTQPRWLIVEACRGPEVTLPGEGGAPSELKTPNLADVRQEWQRIDHMLQRTELPTHRKLIVSGDEGRGPYGSPAAIRAFLQDGLGVFFDEPRKSQDYVFTSPQADYQQLAKERMQRQVTQIADHNRQVLHDSAAARRDYMNKLDTSSLEKFVESQEMYLDIFNQDIIGDFELDPLPFNPRIRKSYDEEKWTGYEVVLDVFPDVFAYGILLVPKDLQDGEKRPVVVCQHGLEGRPQDVVAGDHRAYHDYAAKLAERGFITFAPQNIYIHGDKFRSLQRKANPLGKTLFSIMVPQHRQLTDWLKTLPFVDGERIGFYGLSYGGKSAMRIPPLVDNYCLSICSADFNEWVWKNASTDDRHSYVWTGEYEIFEYGLGLSFNYAEMAALIAPRPFMVERGHFDGVAPDEMVAYEFAKVRNLYQAQLGIGDRCEIEWFVGPHTINGQGTFDFLHRHLKWPQPE
jgi:cephalosporin-C deacetylase-like acetyl esterase